MVANGNDDASTSLLAYTITLKFHFVSGVKHGSYNIVHHRKYIDSIVAAEKHPLSYQTPQSAIDNALRGVKNWGQIGEGMVGF